MQLVIKLLFTTKNFEQMLMGHQLFWIPQYKDHKTVVILLSDWQLYGKVAVAKIATANSSETEYAHVRHSKLSRLEGVVGRAQPGRVGTNLNFFQRT